MKRFTNILLLLLLLSSCSPNKRNESEEKYGYKIDLETENSPSIYDFFSK